MTSSLIQKALIRDTLSPFACLLLQHGFWRWPFAALKRETKHPDGAASAAWPSSSRCSCIGGHPSDILLALQALPRPLGPCAVAITGSCAA